MIQVNGTPRCVCGNSKWKFEMGQISTGPFAAGSKFFHCPACKRIAAQHGIEDSCIQVFLISRNPCGKTETFSDKVDIWIGDKIQGLVDEAYLATALDTQISIDNPDQDNVVLYVPNQRGNWIEMK